MVYFIKEALRGLLKAKLMTLVSIVTVAVALAVIGASAVAAHNVRTLYRKSAEQVDCVVYIKEGPASGGDSLDRHAEQVRAVPGVATAVAVTRDEAWERFSLAYGKQFLEAVDDNPFPASIEVRLRPEDRSRGTLDRVTARLRELPFVESVDYSAEWQARLAAVGRYLTAALAVLLVVCAMILHFIVSNTIKLTIYARRELVVNMRYVGATGRFIKAPFILEGIIQGLAGAFLAVAVMWVFKLSAGTIPFAWGPAHLFKGIIAAGVVFGWLGSSSAVRKFLA